MPASRRAAPDGASSHGGSCNDGRKHPEHWLDCGPPRRPRHFHSVGQCRIAAGSGTYRSARYAGVPRSSST
jgi:hypothetical protein